MTSEHGRLAKHQPSIYRIIVQEPLDEDLSVWFDGLNVTTETGSDGRRMAVFTGPVADQAALRGLLTKIWDLNLTIISVIRVESP